MASGPGQNSRDDLVDPRWTFPNNLDTNKRRPKKQGNKGLAPRAEGFANNPSNGEKLNISFNEADHSGQQKQLHPFSISDKKENVKPKQPDPSLFNSQHSMQNYEKALNPVTAQELEKLEIMISLIQQEQKEKQDQINKDEPRGAEAPPQKIIHPKEKLPMSHHRHSMESLQHSNESKSAHKRICEKPAPDYTEAKWKMGEKDQMAQNTFDSIDDLYKDLLMAKRIKRLALREQFDDDDSNSRYRSPPTLEEKKPLQEKKNNVDLHYVEPSPTLYNNYNCEQGSELEFCHGSKNSQEPHSSSHSSFESNDNKQKQLEEIKVKICHLQKMININLEQISSKSSHLEEIQGKCLRNNNLNQFPARRHYEAEGRANEEPDIVTAAAASANSEEDENEVYDDKQPVDKKAHKAKIQLQKLFNFITSLEGNSETPIPVSPKSTFSTCPNQQNCPRHEEVQEKAHTASRPTDQFASDRKNIEFVHKQLNKIFEHLPLSPDILLPTQHPQEKLTDMTRKFEHFKSHHSTTESEASQKDNNLSYKQRQSEQGEDNQQQMALNEELRKQKLILRELLSHRSMEQCYSHRQPQQNEECSHSGSSINSEEGNSTPPSNNTAAASTAPAPAQPSATWGGFSVHDNLDDTQPDDDDEDDDDSGLVNYSQFPHPPNNRKLGYRESPNVPKNQSFHKYAPPRQDNLHQHHQQMSSNRRAGPSAPEPSVAAATGAPSSETSSSSWQWFTQHVQHQLDQMNTLFQAIVQEQQVLASRFLAPSSLTNAFGPASRPNLSLLLLSLSQCYHMLYMQQLEIQHLHRCIQQSPEPAEQPIHPTTEGWLSELWTPPTQPEAPPPSETLNNQVPPRTRANNFWDNFRSYSCQNLLSSTSSIKNEAMNLNAPATNAHDNQLGNRTHRIMNSNDSSSLPAQATSFYERPVPNVEVQQQMKIKKPNLAFNKVSTCTAKNKSSSSSEESPSNLATPPCSNVCPPATKSPAKLLTSTGGPFISAVVEFAKVLGQSGCSDLAYLIEILRQVQALNSEPLKMQALHTLQELASHAQGATHSARHNTPPSLATAPLEKGPPSSTGAVRKAPKWHKQEQSSEFASASSSRELTSSLLDPEHPLHSQLQAFLSKYSELNQADLALNKEPTTQTSSAPPSSSAAVSTTPKVPFITQHSGSPTVNPSPSFPTDAQNPSLPNTSDVGPHHRAEEDLSYEPEGDDLAEADQKASDDSLLGAVGGTDEDVPPSGDTEPQPKEASSRNSFDGVPCDEETREEDHIPLGGEIPKGPDGAMESRE